MPRFGPSLFIQPHYDDIALSCGGVARACADAGAEPAMVTVFASEIVDEMVGPFARWKHARWGLHDPDAVSAERRKEDAAAAAMLGCGIRWLGMPDAIYRGDRYVSDADLYGPLHVEELDLAEHLAVEVMNLPEWRDGNSVFVPLAVGDHVDHQVVFEAGRRLAARGVDTWAYEDLPYAIHTPAALQRRLDAVQPHLGEPWIADIGASLASKLDAVACYGSQVPVIFRFTSDFRRSLTDHAIAAGGGRPAERLWRVRP